MVYVILCPVTFVLPKCEAVFFFSFSLFCQMCQCINFSSLPLSLTLLLIAFILCCTVIHLTLFYLLMWWRKSSVKSCFSTGQARLSLRAHEGSLPCSHMLTIVFCCHPVESISYLCVLCVNIPFNFTPLCLGLWSGLFSWGVQARILYAYIIRLCPYRWFSLLCSYVMSVDGHAFHLKCA
jgi:hypothetical protein